MEFGLPGLFRKLDAGDDPDEARATFYFNDQSQGFRWLLLLELNLANVVASEASDLDFQMRIATFGAGLDHFFTDINAML